MTEDERQQAEALNVSAGKQRLEYERNELLAAVREKVFMEAEVKTMKAR